MSTERPDKARLVAALRARIQGKLQRLRDSQKSAHQDAIHEEMRQEDPKDTRAIEAQYFARGMAEQVEELLQTVAALSRFPLNDFDPDDPVGLSALVGLGSEIYFLVPVAGGEPLEIDGVTVKTLTPHSPLGAALCGRFVDDEVELDLPKRRLSEVIEWIA